MFSSSTRKILQAVGVFLALWLGVNYLLPVALPFLAGTLLALAAEPAVSLGVRRFRLPRGLSAGLGVTATLLLLMALLTLLVALGVRELENLTEILPDLQQSVSGWLTRLQDWLLAAAARAPEGIGSLLTRLVGKLFGSGSALLEQLAGHIPNILSSLLGWLPEGALGLGTGVLAGFMISSRLPKLKQDLTQRIPNSWKEKFLPALRRLGNALGGWLKAQLKLSGVTFLILTVGFLLLQISYAPLWAFLIALVDAVPMLGTGTVLIPWAVIELLQGEQLPAVGLLCLYAAAALTRSVLEPRLVGRQLGLDPLVTLVFLYMGYKFWGLPGMLLSPILAVTLKSLTENTQAG